MESIISASQTFFEEFQSEKLEIENLITELTSEEEILKVKQKLSVLEQKYNNSLIFLPKYDQNSYKKKLLELNVFLKEKLLLMKNKGLNTSFSTQKKFSFKTKPKEKKPAENSINQLLDNNDVEDIKEFVPPNSATTVSNLTRDIVVIGDTVREVEGKNNDDCYILNSTESIILIEKPTYTLHLKNLKSCLVVSKNFIKGSIFFEGCVNCSFILACHQFRMHDSKHTKVFLFSSSHPIIEDCFDIKFSKFPISLISLQPEINTNDFEKLNFFDKVNDFKWLKKTASPNFQVMEDPSSLENVILLLRETFDRCENEESKENLLIKVVLFNNE